MEQTTPKSNAKTAAGLAYPKEFGYEKGMNRTLPALLLAPLLALLLSACSPNVETRGHIADPDWKEQVKVGQTNQQQVLAALASPSTVSTFGDEVWYYITMTRESYAFFEPTVTDEEVIRIAFDGSGTVSEINEFDKEQMREFAIAKRVTPTEGHQMTMIEQMLGNLGRFNAPSGGAANRNINRGGGVGR